MSKYSKILKVTPILAILLATIAIGFAPIFVRLSETSATSVAFWRMIFSIPLLALGWVLLPSPTHIDSLKKPRYRDYGLLIFAGITFAFDIMIWNFALNLTSVAKAALFVNFSPLFVALIARIFLRHSLIPGLWYGMFIAIGGGILLIWPHVNGQKLSLLGDGLCFLAAIFYAAYILAIQSARQIFNTWSIMTIVSIVIGIVAFLMSIIFNQTLAVAGIEGWLALLGLAIIVHVIGQSLIAYALFDLSATISSIILLLQPVTSTIAAWWIFDEYLVKIQILGMIIVLFGIGFAKFSYFKSMPNAPLIDN